MGKLYTYIDRGTIYNLPTDVASIKCGAWPSFTTLNSWLEYRRSKTGDSRERSMTGKSFKGFEGRDLEVKEKRGFIGSRMGLVANQPRDSPVFRLSRYVAQSLSESFSRFVTTVRTLNSGSVVTVPFTVSLNVSYALSMYARIPSTWA